MRRMLIAIFVVAVIACGKNNEPPPPSSGSPNAQPESAPVNKKDPALAAHQLFGQLCATCHGQDGTGNGPAAAQLNPKPRNYTDAAWQASVTDEDIKKTILLGGQATGKSPMMPGNPQLRDEPAELDELVKIIRGFKK